MAKGIPKNGVNKGWLKKGHKTWNKGISFSPEVRKKMSIKKIGKSTWNKGKKEIRPEVIEKYRQATLKNPRRYWLGKKRPEIGILTSKRLKGTKAPWNIERCREQFSGDKNYNWKGGISKIDKSCRCMSEYKQWRSDCFVRDNWTCQTCRISGVYVTVHHKKSFSKIIKENNIKNVLDARKCSELWDINNGVTLCEDCHKLTDNYKGRANTK